MGPSNSLPESAQDEARLELAISDHLVRLVQILFGLVVTQSLLLYRDLLLHPFGQGHWIAFLALVSVCVAVVWSWLDWHEMMARNPYKVRTKASHHPERRRLFSDVRDLEKLRFVFDLAVVTVYAYLLFSIEPFKAQPDGNIGYFLLGHVFVALTYYLSGAARQMVYGWQASNIPPILHYGVLALLLAISYFFLRNYWYPSGALGTALNVSYVTVSGFATLAYRRTRRRFTEDRKRRKATGKRVGVDVDGVLGNQIPYILGILSRKFGTTLRFNDIVQWDLPVGPSNIAIEIKTTMINDPEYALSMPRHKNARRMLRELFDANTVVVITARPPEAEERTKRWLLRHRLPHDEFRTAKEASKSEHGLDVLVDDYSGNVRDFLRRTNGVAILVDRPWNRDRASVEEWIPDRLRIVTDLKSVPVVIHSLLGDCR